MHTVDKDQTPTAPVPATVSDTGVRRILRPLGRFAAHYLEMCAVMCLGAVPLSVTFFGTAALLGYANLPERLPVLSALVVAINLSVPMAVWMRFRCMPWRPTVEMSGATMAVGLVLIVGYWLGIVAAESLIEVQTSLACPVMLAVMLVRFPLYSRHTGHRRHTVPSA
jgi:hypothetical protein